MTSKKAARHLPLTEATYYILLALQEARHGYAVMQEAENRSRGTVKLAPGTLYGALTNLEEHKLIERTGQDGRRKIYHITDLGRQVLKAQQDRYRIMLNEPKETSRD